MKTPVTLLALAFAAAISSAANAADYHVVSKIPLGGDKSRFDYLRVDPENRHLFIANDKRFVVMDLDTGKKVGEIGPTARAHGVAIVPKANKGFATSGSTNEILMFDLKTLAVESVIKSTGRNPDGIEYDADTDRVYVANGASGSITVIDPTSGAVVGTISIPGGKLEAMVFDGKGMGYVNDEANNCVHVFDLKTQKATVNWPSSPGEGGTGLAIDREHRRMFSACGNNRLAVFDLDSGKVVATPTIGEDPDAAHFEPSTGNIFVSNSDGTMTVLHEDGPDTYGLVQTVTTGDGAKTSCLFDGKVYLPTAKFGPVPAATKDAPNPRAPVIPGTFVVLVVGNKDGGSP